MRKWLRKLKRNTLKVLDLPSDVILDLPRLTMIGFVQLYIENHRGVLLFNDKELRLLLKKGHLIVRGEELVIRAILTDELLLEGSIHLVQYFEQEEGK
jgi:sporulation protein YqfC